jgi:maleate isomerase
MMIKKTITGTLSKKEIVIPNVNLSPMPELAPAGLIKNGETVTDFGSIASKTGYPDVRSYQKKLGLLIPATNTSMEHELWGIIFNNQNSLGGVGLHTSNVMTPKPNLKTEEDLREYKRLFLAGLEKAIEQALLAQPEYLIMGMSLEHIISGIDGIVASMNDAESLSNGISWATWHDAINCALTKFKAKKIAIITPFDKIGNDNATQMFEDLGYDVVTSIGFSCANALHIAHIPDWAKEKAIMDLLAVDGHSLDAIVQCGTNMSMINVAEKLEPIIDVPILGINAVTFWYALRELGFTQPLANSSRLLKEF